MRLTFELVNGTVSSATNEIQALIETEDIFYVISFGSQHTSEDTVSIATTPPDEARGHRRATASRVSLAIPAGTRFTVGNLLALAAYAVRVDPRADGAAGDPGAQPLGDVTSIEVPASLILSPASTGPTAGRFTAEREPIIHDDVSELWRARLIAAGGVRPTLRAIARSLDEPTFPDDDDHFDHLVEQTVGADGIPLVVDELSLSSHGATLDINGAWASGLLAAYRHRAVNGRDVHVEVVTRGYLAPFGHPASLTTLTERELRTDVSGDLTASLTGDTYLAIAQPVVAYPADDSIYMPDEGRGLPFTVVTAADDGSGPVGKDRIILPNGSAISRNKACVLTRGGSDLVVSYTATDRTGNAGITFALPAVFVADSEAYTATSTVNGTRTVLDKLVTWYAESAADSRRDLQLDGQAVGWADPSPRGEAGSVQTTNRIRIELDRPDLGTDTPQEVEDALRAVGRPAFYPGVATAWVVDLASTATFGADPPETEVTVAQRWLDHGIGDLNVDLGYLDLVAPTVVQPAIDALGMLSTSLDIGTFGQVLGAALKFPEDGPPGTEFVWDAIDALGGLPKLLGSLDLPDLLDPIDMANDALAAKGLPTLSVDPQFDDGIPPLPTGACFRFTWEPKLHSFPKDGDGAKTFVVTGDFDDEVGLPEPASVFDGGDTHVLLEVTTCIPENSTTFEARLERFAVQLPPANPVVAILFQHVTYTNDNGSSSVETDVADWLFVNALSWLEPLKDFLAGLLDGGAPTFDGGIFIDYGIPIPGFTLGVLNVAGLRVDLGIDLPDSGSSSIDLAVCRRDDPFRITIMGYGGDGSFGLEVDARQIVLIEGALAVSYELAVDMFIAKASLSASLGVFVEFERLDNGDGEVTLGAYAELRGSVSVLGLVELSGAVTVALTYNITSKLLRGVAAVTGEVSSIFGKKEVTHDVAVEVALGEEGGGLGAGGGALGARRALPAGAVSPDLSFRDHYSKPQWTTYCAAFAA